MLNRWIDLYCRALGALMVVCLTLMVVMVAPTRGDKYRSIGSGLAIDGSSTKGVIVVVGFELVVHGIPGVEGGDYGGQRWLGKFACEECEEQSHVV